MTEQIIIAGVGGQGAQALGKIIASTALKEGKNVTWLPSYGAEMRGGPSNCHVIISDESIGSPFVVHASALLAMSQSAIQKFEQVVMPGGLICVNTSMVSQKSKRNDVVIAEAAFSDIAVQLGDARYANMVMLGAYLAHHPVLQLDVVQEELRDAFSKKGTHLVDVNLQAICLGAEAVRKSKMA